MGCSAEHHARHGQRPTPCQRPNPAPGILDAYVADEAERTLLNLSQSRQPWLLAVGFFKPHLPFAAPKRYLDLHPVQSLPARNPGSEKKPAWPSTWHGSGELHGNYTKLGSDGEHLFPEVSLAMRQAYAACVSYVDAQVGRVLAALRKHHLDDNTVIVPSTRNAWCNAAISAG